MLGVPDQAIVPLFLPDNFFPDFLIILSHSSIEKKGHRPLKHHTINVFGSCVLESENEGFLQIKALFKMKLPTKFQKHINKFTKGVTPAIPKITGSNLGAFKNV